MDGHLLRSPLGDKKQQMVNQRFRVLFYRSTALLHSFFFSRTAQTNNTTSAPGVRVKVSDSENNTNKSQSMKRSNTISHLVFLANNEMHQTSPLSAVEIARRQRFVDQLIQSMEEQQRRPLSPEARSGLVRLYMSPSTQLISMETEAGKKLQEEMEYY